MQISYKTKHKPGDLKEITKQAFNNSETLRILTRKTILNILCFINSSYPHWKTFSMFQDVLEMLIKNCFIWLFKKFIAAMSYEKFPQIRKFYGDITREKYVCEF